MFPPAQYERIERAYRLVERLYEGKEHHFLHIPLIEQVSGIARLALTFCPDPDAVIAVLLHKVLQLRMMTLQDITAEFGPDVRSITSALHLLAHITTDDQRRSIDDLRIMLVSVSDDVRAVLLTLCRRCHCVEHLEHVDRKTRIRVCREALQLFAPVAARLGIYTLKHRLENAAFPVVFPTEAENIGAQLSDLKERHGAFLPEVVKGMEEYLRGNGITASVSSREKHPYSIFLKQRSKGFTSVEHILDLFAIRVVVDHDADCYQTLGLLHKYAMPLSHRFKDYISFPKPNGYQSLHTCLLRVPGAPQELTFEVQIRTRQMHKEAEYGVAAHWTYKEGRAGFIAKRAQLKDVLQRQQLQELIANGDEQGDAPDHPTQDSSFVDHIYVLTPRGDIVELSEDATPLDFAFMIHTDLGLAYKAAKVNGVIVPISHKLENGDVVEIVSASQPMPSPNWLDEVRTSAARHKLRAYFAVKDRLLHLSHGRELLNAELRMRHLPPLDTDLSIFKSLAGKSLSVRDREDILIKVGKGGEAASSILRQAGVLPEQTLVARPQRARRREHIVKVEGGVAMPLRFAKCCSADALASRPPIVGFITRRGDVTVHRAGCGMLKNANPERRIAVQWTD